jgi:hypothetical protein
VAHCDPPAPPLRERRAAHQASEDQAEGRGQYSGARGQGGVVPDHGTVADHLLEFPDSKPSAKMRSVPPGAM